jgi:NTP pyrophosphatase (non-canonical NTP hydrolase)
MSPDYIAGSEFILSFNKVAQRIEDWANIKGWNSDDPQIIFSGSWEDVNGGIHPSILRDTTVAYDISKLGLMVTEIAEAIEGRRHGDPASDKIPEFTCQEEELADCIVRIMHHAAHRKLRVAEALVTKLDYNDNRPYKHGKLA